MNGQTAAARKQKDRAATSLPDLVTSTATAIDAVPCGSAALLFQLLLNQ